MGLLISLHISLTAFAASARYWLASWLLKRSVLLLLPTPLILSWCLHRRRLLSLICFVVPAILMILFKTYVSCTFSSRPSPTTTVLDEHGAPLCVGSWRMLLTWPQTRVQLRNALDTSSICVQSLACRQRDTKIYP